MDKTDVIHFLSSMPVGTIIAWASVIFIIVSAVAYVLMKLYKIFEKYRQAQNEDDEMKSTIKIHDKQLQEIEMKLDINLKNTVDIHEKKLKQISEQLSEIQQTLDEQNKAALRGIRHSIVRTGEEAISNGSITIRKLRSLEELYEEYSKDFDGNGYVTTLMAKVRKLEVIGKLDENDEDVET